MKRRLEGLASFARDTVSISIQAVDVRPNNADWPPYIDGAISATTCAINVTRYGHAWVVTRMAT